MMASAVRTYIERFAPRPGKRWRCSPTMSDGWKTVETALRAGVEIAAVIDLRSRIPEEFRALAEVSGFRVFNGVVHDVSGGASGISKISVAQANGGTVDIAADTLAM